MRFEWLKGWGIRLKILPNDPNTGFNPTSQHPTGAKNYYPNICNVRWRILRLLSKLRHIILPFASTNLALVSSETVLDNWFIRINFLSNFQLMPSLNKQTNDWLSVCNATWQRQYPPPYTKQSSTQHHSLLAKVGPDYQVVELGMKWNHARNRSERINYLTPFHCSPMLG